MGLSWQRRVMGWPKAHDFTLCTEGQEVAWTLCTIVRCPNCGRLGAQFPTGVVHKASVDREYLADVCAVVPEGEPPAVLVAPDGKVLEPLEEPRKLKKEDLN